MLDTGKDGLVESLFWVLCEPLLQITFMELEPFARSCTINYCACRPIGHVLAYDTATTR
jgi:hypothetical protein